MCSKCVLKIFYIAKDRLGVTGNLAGGITVSKRIGRIGLKLNKSGGVVLYLGRIHVRCVGITGGFEDGLDGIFINSCQLLCRELTLSNVVLNNTNKLLWPCDSTLGNFVNGGAAHVNGFSTYVGFG